MGQRRLGCFPGGWRAAEQEQKPQDLGSAAVAEIRGELKLSRTLGVSAIHTLPPAAACWVLESSAVPPPQPPNHLSSDVEFLGRDS